MAHNALTVLGAKPNAAGNISINLSDFSEVTGTPNDGEVLVYSSATQTWGPGASPSAPYALFGRGESDDYSNNGFALTSNATWGFYDTAPRAITGVTFNYVTGTSWLESITLGAGNWSFLCAFGCVFSASGVLGLIMRDSSGATISNQARIGATATTSSVLAGSVEVSTTLTISPKIQVATNLSATQGTTPAEQGWLFIQKLS